ncbi:hypothetical protein AK88_05595 [Plasmodium fragile]|uniref:Schizont-infected cell agglutination C-terminal domain-containing protein n=1 Tax=Plasmodium fragile TaxID=5857 RepID=A0A0D9QCS0_PLAFR|nr:uncharacterized protein AK88_05595 [Plasmodium fragile]KJP84774.1 hypothetical protein AK88_05595 [Plasmodium fragile]
MRDEETNNNIVGVSTTKQALSGHNVSATESDGTNPLPPPADDPWRCMETIQLETDRYPPNDDDPWNCMETIHTEEDQSPSTVPRDATSDCPHWINWIEQHKHMLRECTTQPWFNALKSEWKHYLRDHMAANGASGEHRTAATMERKKLHAWKEWVAQQHQQLRTYSEEEWFPHLLNNVEEETESHKGEVPGVETDLNMQIVPAAADLLRVRDVPRSQLHPQPYMNTPLTAKIWMLLLAAVIEECEVERRMQQTELYVDDLLQTC